MISVYAKSGVLEETPVVSFILESQKHTWTKAHQVKYELPSNSFSRKVAMDAMGILYALKHIKRKYKKKKVTVYCDSAHVLTALQKKDGEYINKTSIDLVEKLRDHMDSFNNIESKPFIDECPKLEDLEHIFVECALDGIEIDEKD
jgi:O-succinylbenzoate synthase